ASRFKVILYAIVPQVMPTFWAVSILRWDINLRESTVLGLVGAGGIGIILQSAIDTFNWREAATVLLAILTLVILGEIIAALLRKRIIGRHGKDGNTGAHGLRHPRDRRRNERLRHRARRGGPGLEGRAVRDERSRQRDVILVDQADPRRPALSRVL